MYPQCSQHFNYFYVKCFIPYLYIGLDYYIFKCVDFFFLYHFFINPPHRFFLANANTTPTTGHSCLHDPGQEPHKDKDKDSPVCYFKLAEIAYVSNFSAFECSSFCVVVRRLSWAISSMSIFLNFIRIS